MRWTDSDSVGHHCHLFDIPASHGITLVLLCRQRAYAQDFLPIDRYPELPKRYIVSEYFLIRVFLIPLEIVGGMHHRDNYLHNVENLGEILHYSLPEFHIPCTAESHVSRQAGRQADKLESNFELFA
jgi:hypothetical protein